MADEVGFEPTCSRLTAGRLTYRPLAIVGGSVGPPSQPGVHYVPGLASYDAGTRGGI